MLSSHRSLAALFGAILLAGGCGTAPPRGYPVSGRIGVATVSAPTADMPSVGGSAAIGALTGAVALPIFFPVLAPMAAFHGARCTGEFHNAYPEAAARLDDILQREYSPGELLDTFLKATRERTSAQIIALDALQPAGSAGKEASPLAVMERQGLDFLIELDLQQIGFLPNFDAKCVRWNVRVRLQARLWKKGEREPLFSTLVNTFKDRYPAATFPLTEFKPMLTEPGALRARLADILAMACNRLLDSGEFRLTQ